MRAKTRSHMTHGRLILILVLGCVVLNLAVDGALWLALRQSRIQYEESAQTNVYNLSKVLEQNVLTLIKEIDLTLRTVADEGTRVGAITRPNNHLFMRFLENQSARIPDILGLRVIDHAGNVIYSTNDVTNSRVNEGDREHFIRVRDDPNSDLVITGPILGRVTNKWVLIFSRRMSRPDGSFSAEVHASVAVDTIIGIFSAADMGPHGVVSMWDKTTTLARHPEEAGGKNAIGTQKPSPQLKALLDAETRSAFYTATAPTDNVKKSYSIRKVGQFPLWVIAGTAEDDYLAPWKTEAWQTALAALLFAIITIILNWQVYRYWRAGKLIRDSEEQLNSAQALAHIGSWIRDLHSGEYVWSDEVFRIFGFTPQSLAPDDGLLLAAVHPDDKQGVIEMLADLSQGRENLGIDCRIVLSDDSVRWVHIEGRAEPGAGGIPDRISGFIRDISESTRAKQILARERKFLAKILDTTSTLIVVLDPKGAIIRYNAACERLTGISSEHVKGRAIWDVFAVKEDINIVRLATATAKDMPFLNGYETSFKAVDRSERTIVWTNSMFCEEGETDCCIISTGVDVTDRKALERELIKAASIDKLTALINRQALDKVISREIERSIRYHHPLSLIMFDIDHFKVINDTYGHLAGDSVLREVALLVEANLRAADSLGRWGGEEFMIVLPETSMDEACLAAEKLQRLFERQNFTGINNELTASFGVTEYSNGDNIDRLLQRVDDALYVAKQEGRNRVVGKPPSDDGEDHSQKRFTSDN